MPKILDLTGERFGKLVAIKTAPRSETNQTRWHCRCDCGTETIVRTINLRSENSRSCGCMNPVTRNTDRVLDPATGKMVRPDGFHCWTSIHSRCYCKDDENYPNYGGRGITVCDRWRRGRPNSLANFLKDMGPRPSPKHSVGRQMNDKGYSPENCRWETPFQQSNNRRGLNLITHNGKTQTITAWNRELGFAPGGLEFRLRRGWSLEEAISTPRRTRAPAAPGIKPETTGCVNQGLPPMVFAPGFEYCG